MMVPKGEYHDRKPAWGMSIFLVEEFHGEKKLYLADTSEYSTPELLVWFERDICQKCVSSGS